MEKETKRILQKMIEIIQEQQEAILALQHNARPSARRFEDGLGQRIGRITQQVANLQSFEFDWNRLCDRHYAAKS
jgi:hypothetical protein